jgi:N-acetylglucosaminyl-diphospho-decaprenol L-rhamnosyltransferase
MNTVVFLDPKRRRHQSAPDAVSENDVTVSVVMVSYHTGPVLDDAVAALLDQNVELELILVDNGNPAEALAQFRHRAAIDPRLRLVTGHGNIGYAAACNRGAREARGRYLLLLNPDCILLPDTIGEMIRAVSPFGHPLVAGCRIVNPDGTDQRGSRRELPTPWMTLVEALRLDRIAPNHPYFKRLNHHDTPLPDAVSAVPAISGAFMLITLDDYRSVGGMDEGYFLHVEDLDFCFAMSRSGGTVLFVPQIKVVHHKSTSRVSPIFIEWHKAMGFTRYFTKNFIDHYPRFFLRVVNMLIWSYFLLRVAAMGKEAVFRSLTSVLRGHRAGNDAQSIGKSGRKGRAA